MMTQILLGQLRHMSDKLESEYRWRYDWADLFSTRDIVQ